MLICDNSNCSIDKDRRLFLFLLFKSEYLVFSKSMMDELRFLATENFIKNFRKEIKCLILVPGIVEVTLNERVIVTLYSWDRIEYFVD